MEIDIRLRGNISYYLPEGRGRFSLRKSFDEEKTVQEVVKELGLPKDLNHIVAVNGKVIETEIDRPLEDGDEVALFTPNSGG